MDIFLPIAWTDKMRRYLDWYSGPDQGYLGWREQALGLRFGSLDQPSPHVLRRTDLRPRLLHGTECC